jgi:hypothetical protein
MQVRDLRFAWEREVQRLVRTCLPDDPPAWRVPSGSDPWDLLDVLEANRALRDGYPVQMAAEVLAARTLARAHGRSLVHEAVRSRPPVGIPPPEKMKRGPKPRVLSQAIPWAA